jgi:predicted DNA-binding transcriptional regulator YafY
MPVNKKQILRMVKFVAEMRKESYPNCRTFAELLRQADLNENLNISCTEKTIHRDIQALKNEFNAPIEFDSVQNGYFLTDPEWEFACPILTDEHVLAILCSTKLASDIVPGSLRGKIQNAVDELYTTNIPDFADKDFIDSFFIASGVKVKIDSEIFRTVFDAWRKRRVLKIDYSDGRGNISSREIEPHVLTYHNASWYVKGFCLAKNEERMFAVHRIKGAEIIGKYFVPDPKITKRVDPDSFFDGERVKNVKLHFVPEVAKLVMEQTRTEGEKKEMMPDGSVMLTIPSVVKFSVIQWVLGSGGQIRVVEPASLRIEVIEAAHRVIERNSDSP